MRKNLNLFRLSLSMIFLIGNYAPAFGQKLPGKQNASINAPANVKIDGKLQEWPNGLQAYNAATGIYYSLANNDDNLYLIIKATDPDIINKIVDGGITLTIQSAPKKSDKQKVSITYPVTDNNVRLFFNLRGRRGTAADTSVKAADSVMARNNKTLDQKCKWIRTSGIKDVDTLISVYNEDDIKAAGRFDNKKAYQFEMSIALKYLGLAVTGQNKFNYQLRINGAKPSKQMTARNKDGSPVVSTPGKVDLIALFNQDAEQESAPTDFWGEYTLVTKP